MIIPFTFPVESIPYFARKDSVVSYVMPSGCSMQYSYDLSTWSSISTSSPFTASADMHLRVVCAACPTPVQAILAIEAPL